MDEQTLAWWQRKEIQGARALILSSLSFSLMTVCVKQLGGRIPVSEIVLVRSLVSIALTGIAMLHGRVNPFGSNRRLLLLRGICGSLALLCFFEAITALPLASATLLQYTYPTLTAGAAWLLLGERLRRRIGIAVVLDGRRSVGDSAEWLGAPRKRVQHDGSPWRSLVHGPGIRVRTPLSARTRVSFPISSCLDPHASDGDAMESGHWGWIGLAVGGVLTQLGQIWVTEAELSAGSEGDVLNYVQVLFAAGWGWIWFNESITVLACMVLRWC